MIVAVQRHTDEPVYVQIARQVQDHISARRIAPGTVLPAVRSLASDLGVNLNTVARAYRLLEADGFVTIEDRAGATVAEPPRAPSAGTRTRLRAELRELLSRMRQAGVGAGELRTLAATEIERLVKRGSKK